MFWGSIFLLVIGIGMIISSLDKSTLLIENNSGGLGYIAGPITLLCSFLTSFVVKDDPDELGHIGLNPTLNTFTGIMLLIAIVIVVRSWRHMDD